MKTENKVGNYLLQWVAGGIFYLSLQLPMAAYGTPAEETDRVEVKNVTLTPYMLSPELPSIHAVLPNYSVRDVRLVLRIRTRRVYVYRGDRVQASYPVAVGRQGWETPIGQFQVLEMMRHPGWTNPFTREVVPPGNNNPLGDRWIAFWTDGRDFIGFHGTPNRRSVGQSTSHGCVRMYNEDARELYEMVAPGTPVMVEP